jgi:hypothetical protein
MDDRGRRHRMAGRNREPAARRRVSIILLFACLATCAGAIVSPAAAVSFQVQGLFQFGPAHLAVAFTDSVNGAEALVAARYTLTPQGGAPAITIQQVSLQENQRTVVLTTTATLPPAAAYSVAVSGITSRHGAPLEVGGPTSFTTVVETVTGIAAVHADVNNLIGQSVTVIGQVYLTASSSGGTPSGYIQDGTGRGLNLFGNPLQPVTDVLGSVVEVTGTVALFSSTTVELTPYTAIGIASGMPHLAPRVLTVAQANSSQWEGTYIQTTATLTGPPAASGAANYTYPAQGGGTPLTFRVRNATGIDPAGFTTGDVVTGAGAGTKFLTTWQITVGNTADFYKGGGGSDITPPALVSAAGNGGGTTVTVEFSEPLGAGATTAANYSVYPTANPGAPVAVTATTVNLATVTLTLAASLQSGVAYTVAVSNVQDVAGNTIPAASTIGFTSTVPAAFQVTGVFQFGADYVGVGFSKKVNAAQAIQSANYAFTPSLSISGVTLQENGQTVILHATAALPSASSYSATVSGITSATGEPLASNGPFDFQTANGTVVNIATIQADPSTWNAQTVTVIGQTFVPVGSRGGTPSGYIQDGSGHGINVFGGSAQAAVNALGTVARVTGTVQLYFTTTEITGYTATAIATGQPRLGARVLTAGQANASQWEGSYIETTADLTAITASGASNYNYDATDGGANITFRVGNGLGIPPTQFSVGDRVTGRGAGGAFQATFQINVGNTDDIALAGGGGPDITPPTLASASGSTGSAIVTALFSEPVRPAEANVASNYSVYPAGDPSAPIAVASALLASGGRSVGLTLAAPLQPATVYALTATNITDLAGNTMLPGALVTFTPEQPPANRARLAGVGGVPFPAVTLVRRMSGLGEVFRFEISGPPDAKAACRIFDLQGRLVRVLFDAKLTGTGRRALAWDGRDESFESVPAGAYICHLSVTDLAGQGSETHAPIVVSARLDRGTP